jgi:hypothetical protein
LRNPLPKTAKQLRKICKEKTAQEESIFKKNSGFARVCFSNFQSKGWGDLCLHRSLQKSKTNKKIPMQKPTLGFHRNHFTEISWVFTEIRKKFHGNQLGFHNAE